MIMDYLSWRRIESKVKTFLLLGRSNLNTWLSPATKAKKWMTLNLLPPKRRTLSPSIRSFLRELKWDWEQREARISWEDWIARKWAHWRRTLSHSHRSVWSKVMEMKETLSDYILFDIVKLHMTLINSWSKKWERSVVCG